MSAKLTQEEAEAKVEALGIGIKLIGEYKNVHSKTAFKCRCGKDFIVMPCSIFKGSTKGCGCFRMLTQEEAEAKVEALGTGVKLIGGYKGIARKATFKCYCGKDFIARVSSILSGNSKSCGCLSRGGGSGRGRDTEKVVHKLRKLGIELIGEHKNILTKVLMICSCGTQFKATPTNVIYNGTRCGECTKGISRGELAIKDTLIKYGCQHVREWTREATRKITSLRYDFYLPSYHAIIEFNGEQHHRPVRFKKMPEEAVYAEFIKIQARDKEKRDWAAASGIPLLDISYDEIDQVEDKVWNFLMELRARRNKKVA